MPLTNLVALTNNCFLSLSGANLLLSQGSGGGQINISGTFYPIPASGPTLAPTGLSASTLYYIYAAISGTSIVLEASTTGYVNASGLNNLAVKSTDSSRSLVGMARTNASVAWVNSANQRFVRSYYNDTGISGSNAFTANRSTSSTSYVELNTEIRCEGIFWNDETVYCTLLGGCENSVATNNINTGVTIDGATTFITSINTVQPSGTIVFQTVGGSGTADISGLGGTGYHFFTVCGASPNGSSATWNTGCRLEILTSGRRGY